MREGGVLEEDEEQLKTDETQDLAEGNTRVNMMEKGAREDAMEGGTRG